MEIILCEFCEKIEKFEPHYKSCQKSIELFTHLNDKLIKMGNDLAMREDQLKKLKSKLNQVLEKNNLPLNSEFYANPKEEINLFLLKQNGEFKKEWSYFEKFCNLNNFCNYEEKSIIEYLKTTKCNSTHNKKLHYIKCIFKEIYGNDLKFLKRKTNNLNTPIIFSPDDEKLYFSEQESKDKEDYIIQKLASNFACRFIELSALKLKHFSIDKYNEASITFPSFKHRKERKEIITCEKLINDLNELFKYKGITNKEEYVFKAGKSINNQQRNNTLRKRINYKMKNSSSINNETSTKVFRNTAANVKLNETFEKAKIEIGKTLGHAAGSTSTNSYVGVKRLEKCKIELRKVFPETQNLKKSILENCLICKIKDESVTQCEICMDFYHIKCDDPSYENKNYDTYNCLPCRNLIDNKKCCVKCHREIIENYPVCDPCDNYISTITKKIYLNYFGTSNTPSFKVLNKSYFKISDNTPEQNDIFKLSITKALIIKGITYNDDQVMTPEGLYHLNNCTEEIQSLKKEDIEIFKNFKKCSPYGNNIPIEIKWDHLQGFIGVATSSISAGTIICEYTGGIKMFRETLFSEDDSLMTLLKGVNSKYSLVMSPEHIGNVGRFLSGINNKNKKTGNCATIRFKFNNRIHIVIYAYRCIRKNEVLNYNYNAKNSDYPTENFK